MGTWSFRHCPHRTSCGARCRILPNKDPDSPSQILAHGQRVAVGIAFLAGLTFSFNPVALAALPALPLRARRASTLWGAFALGVPFSVAVCPICTPALAVLLGVAAGSASAFTGALLLLAFALGRAIPIAFGTSVIGWAERFPAMGRYQRWLDIGGGVLLVLAGLYLLNAYFFWIPALAV